MKYLSSNSNLFIIILFILPIYSIAKNNLKVDTSFTTNSAYKKVVKDYPFVKVVEPVLPEDVNALRNISYVQYGERELKLDVFYSNSYSNLKPGIILVHGGGWHTGNKSHLFPLAMKLAANGYVAASVEYRLSHEALFPAAIIDVKNAIKWLKKNAAEYKIDTNKIAILGTSAGGQIASLVGFSKNVKDFEDTDNFPGYSSNVHAIVNIDGLLDFLGKGSEEFDEIPNPENPRSAHKWLGASHLENPEVWNKASGINYITKESCPIIFINSSRPRFHAGRDEAIEILEKLGIYYEVHTIDNTPHPFWLFHPWFKTTVGHVNQFLDKIFDKK